MAAVNCEPLVHITLLLAWGEQKRQNKQRGIRRLHWFKSLGRDFKESARSGFFALLSRLPTHCLATAGHVGRFHVSIKSLTG